MTTDLYDTRLDNKYGYSTVIDIPREVAEHQPWFNQTLTRVNDAVVRLGIRSGQAYSQLAIGPASASTTGTSTTRRTSASSCSRASCCST